MSKTILELKNVNAGYGNSIILKDINLIVKEQDFIGIIGPNGGGKTTLLKIILGLIKPFSGEITYNLSDNKAIKNKIGYLPQQFSIDKKFPISVSDVVLSGLVSGKVRWRPSPNQYKKKLAEVLDIIGMTAYKKVAAGELSGGQLQRILLGRALISDPKLLILDEPDAFVDSKFENALYEILKELNKTITILLVSHDLGMISTYIKTIACVNQNLHYHPSNEISSEQLKVYNCPIDIISHGTIPHRVLHDHK